MLRSAYLLCGRSWADYLPIAVRKGRNTVRAYLLRRLAVLALGTVVAALVLSSGAGATPTASLSFTTDSSWTVNGVPASVVKYPSCYAGFGAWTTALGANWISVNACPVPPPETDIYSKTFDVPGTPTSGSIAIAADNEVSLNINGTNVLSQSDAYNNFHIVTNVDITPYLQSGPNTIDAVVTNTSTGPNISGVVARVSVTYDLPDTTAPADSPSVPSGWSSSDQTVDWNWSDDGSGIDAANCPQSSTSSGEGAITLSSTCYDLAGNSNSDSATVYVDKSGPTANPVYLSGWSNSDVTVEWNWTDNGSGIDPANCPASSTSAGIGTFDVSATCSDLVGNSTPASVTVNVDETNPVDAPDIPSGWSNTDATVDWNWTDAGGSGIDAANCAQSSTSSGEGTITLNSSCSDVAGNSSVDSASVKVDKTDPVVSYTGGGTYTVDQNVTVTCSSSDALSGVASDTCANVSGAAWSLGLGRHDLSATAKDNAGNIGSASTSYTVKADTDSVCALVKRWAKNAGQANSLCVKLNAAAAAVARGQTKTHDNNIDAFDNEVRAQSGKGFTAAQAALLVQFAAAL